MPKIKNVMYRKFLDEGRIDIIEDEHIVRALKNIKGQYARQGRALLITLFFTGARPSEILDMRAGDIYKDGNKFAIRIKGVKRGLPRTLLFPGGRPLIRQLWEYAKAFPLETLLFPQYRSGSFKKYINKKGETNTRPHLSHKLEWYFRIWFEGVLDTPVTPYFLRHSRFSKYAERGALIQDIQMAKGSKRSESVMPYLHMTRSTAKKLSRML